MKKFLFLFLLAPAVSQAQKTQPKKEVKQTAVAADSGMHFEHALSWSDIKAKAKKENKYIFVDAYTTWCGPCKMMAAKIFPQKKVGDFYNRHYINVKFQLDKTEQDNETVKKQYTDAAFIEKEYKVNVYPTYLLFNPQGELVHRAIGSSDAETFIQKGRDGMDPEKQYYTLVKKFRQNASKDTAFLHTVAAAAAKVYDEDVAAEATNAYITALNGNYTKDAYSFIANATKSTRDKGFAILTNNTAAYNAAMGPGAAETKISRILITEKIYPVFRKKEAVNWTAVEDSIKASYPAYAEQVVATAKVIYYQSKRDWENFQQAIVPFMSKYSTGLSPMELNGYAWTVFENCKDATCLAEALNWSKASLKKGDEAAYLDTYANILYRMGNTQEALATEEKALGLAVAEEKPQYQETIDKMKKGEKTWKF
jgi:thiol-disulfide isomerase/thioredoxin